MSSTEVTLPAAFKDIMREKILVAYVDLVPKEQLDALLNKEIEAFFSSELIMTVEQTKIEIKNPSYDSLRGSGYSNERFLTRNCLALGSKMTPFRQLVWSTLYDHIKPKIEKVFEDDKSKANTELDKWFAETVVPESQTVSKQLFTQLASAMSATMFHRTMYSAISTSHSNLLNSLSQAGLNPDVISRISTTPVITNPLPI